MQRVLSTLIQCTLALALGQNSAEDFKITPFSWDNVWPNGRVPYTFDTSYISGENEHTIRSAMDVIQKQTCLEFVPANIYDRYYLRFTDGPACSSLVGRRTYISNQDITLPTWCFNFRNILHELMHAVGFGHEQCRPDRYRYINIHWDNINPKWWHAFHEDADGNYLLKYQVPYDFRSLLHYAPQDFVRTYRNGPALSSKNPHFHLTRTFHLTPLDLLKVNLLYDCKDQLREMREHCVDYYPECRQITERECLDREYMILCRFRCNACHIWGFE